MLCQKCQTNLASVRYAEVVDGQVNEQQLCPGCVAALEKGVPSGFDLADAGRPGRKAARVRATHETETDQVACGVCGIPLSALLGSGRAGCPGCYASFPDQIAPLLLRTHRFSTHKGKSARAATVRDRLRSDLQTKRALLRSVLKAENYEEAARLRDEIRQLESGLALSGSGND